MYKFTLEDSIDLLGITKNRLATEANIRSNTILDIAQGQVKQIGLDTLAAIISTLNKIAKEKGIVKRFNVSDVFVYYEEEEIPSYIHDQYLFDFHSMESRLPTLAEAHSYYEYQNKMKENELSRLITENDYLNFNGIEIDFTLKKRIIEMVSILMSLRDEYEEKKVHSDE